MNSNNPKVIKSNRNTSIGHVYFKENEGVHLYNFIIKAKNETIAKKEPKAKNECMFTENIRVRVAYLVVSKNEAKGFFDENSTLESILEKAKVKYLQYLEDAVNMESKNNTLLYDKLEGKNCIKVDGKIVKTRMAKLTKGCNSCYGKILKDNGYEYACENVMKDEHKIGSDNISLCMFTFNKEIGKKVLEEEEKDLSEDEPYIFMTMAYIYDTNIDENTNEKTLTVKYNAEKVTVSYMPDVIVEYGVFFDGTANNKHNIDFYKNFTAFVSNMATYIKKGMQEKNSDKKTDQTKTDKFVKKQGSVEDYILETENPEFTDKINLKLIEQINKYEKTIKYFDEKSNFEIDNREVLDSQKGKDVAKVFEYLQEVKKNSTGIDDESTNLFVIDKILKDDAEDSSYFSDKTNIVKLYDMYKDDKDDKNNKIKEPTISRFKLYESGAGTSNPSNTNKYEGDSRLGLGFGMGVTGIEGYIFHALQKMITQLREDKYYYVDELVLDVFGFSRGAATARHFVNTLLKDTDVIKGGRKYSVKPESEKDIFFNYFGKEGYEEIGGKYFFNPLRIDIENDIPSDKQHSHHGLNIKDNPYYEQKEVTIKKISIRFVGLYDTVSHFGLIQSNDFKDLNLNLLINKDKIGQVVHLMADDEFRYNFDATSIFEDTNKEIYKKDGNFEEFYLPGAHSDLGGGYVDNERELVQLTTEDSDTSPEKKQIEEQIVNWNNKYNWIINPNIEKVDGSDTLELLINKDKKSNKKEDSNFGKDGFYYFTNAYHRASKNSEKYYNTQIHMFRNAISNEYARVPLKLMYDKATSTKVEEEKVPFNTYDVKYTLKDTLKTTYGILSNNSSIKNSNNNELYKNIKYNFLRHSADINFVNKPSHEDKEKGMFYGERVIYNSVGVKIT